MGIYPQKELDRLDADAIDQADEFVDRVQFIGEPFAPAPTVLIQAIPIDATTAQAVRILKSSVRKIKVDITGGTAAGKKLKSADGTVLGVVDGSIIVPVVKGRADIIAEATGTGTMILGLDGSVDPVAATLITTDTATITFS